MACEKKEVFPVRKKFGIAVRGLAFFRIQLGDLALRSSSGWNRVNSTVCCRRKQDHPLRVPRSTPAFDRVCESENGAAGGVNLFQLPVGEEGNGSAVVRPK